ncbi:MAG: VCBS repeat-containing protein, partial [Planctomycetes bacterium]|nr:VCBS repeat-containing protein [Planctomycetota bacterium]
MRIRGMVLFGAAVLLHSAAGSWAGKVELVRTLKGDAASDHMGTSVSWIGDVDGDGSEDFIGGARLGASSYGSARVYSGEDGSTIYTLTGDGSGEAFGRAVAGVGDVDGDGCPDFAVGSHFSPTVTQIGFVRVFSGADGSTLHTFRGSGTPHRFGRSVSGAGDVNADGCSDIIVGVLNQDEGSANGHAQVLSGKDGAVLHALYPGSCISAIRVSGLGDVNGDGYDDVVAGAAYAKSQGSGVVCVYSGKDGSALHSFWGDGSLLVNLGTHVAGGGDVDGDGCPDFAATGGGIVSGVDVGAVRVYSGSDGSVLHTFHGPEPRGVVMHQSRGPTVSISGDVDGDGCADVAVGWICFRSTTPVNCSDGSVAVYGGTCWGWWNPRCRCWHGW